MVFYLISDASDLIPSEYLGKLPNAQFFASLGGGHLMKGRVPVIIDDKEN